MTNIELKAWELIGQLSPVEQYYFALKILQGVKPKEMDEIDINKVSENQHSALWKGEENLANLVLDRKEELENGGVLPISLEQFKSRLYKDIEQHRS